MLQVGPLIEKLRAAPAVEATGDNARAYAAAVEETLVLAQMEIETAHQNRQLATEAGTVRIFDRN
jgi:hypothetical protein